MVLVIGIYPSATLFQVDISFARLNVPKLALNKQNERVIQDAVAENYEALRYKYPYSHAYHKWWLKQILHHAKLGLLDGVVLDNGCGVGVLLELFSSTYPTVGLDLSYGMLKKALTITAALVQGDSVALPFPDETFDLVFARSLLHHLPEPEQGIHEMYRVLKAGGQVILADTNASSLSTLPRKLAYRKDNFSEHHRNFDRHEYFDWIRSRFRIDHIQYFGYLAYPFGFPDMMGKLSRLPFPITLVRALIEIDKIFARIPGIQQQSWGLIVSASKL